MTHTLRLITSGLLACSLAIAFDAQAAEKKSKGKKSGRWITLFDGKLHGKLRGYRTEGFPEKSWKIDGDALTTIHKNKGGVREDLLTKGKFKNFELSWEWRATKGGNSGVMYRVKIDPKKPAYFTGPEFQMLDDDVHPDGKKDRRRAGCLYDLIEAEGKDLKPVGEWNTSKIVSKNNNFEHWVNGKKVVEFVWGSDEIKELVAKSKFKTWPNFMKMETGHIAFQHHGEEFSIRNMKIRRL
ncbi:MAG: hypothetical protein CMO80_02585 [Verrucomicrobiales bacterium]|nr:hypothetical protein [Verrucomicrobiales bacterium]|tara:strand:- start:7747 stop:8466 length:720 start_codon:yes stop_codon:yes gene_type:complete